MVLRPIWQKNLTSHIPLFRERTDLLDRYRADFFNDPAALFQLFVGYPVHPRLKKFAAHGNAGSGHAPASTWQILGSGMKQDMKSGPWTIFGNDDQFSQLASGCLACISALHLDIHTPIQLHMCVYIIHMHVHMPISVPIYTCMRTIVTTRLSQTNIYSSFGK
jgi:hypothetical protein